MKIVICTDSFKGSLTAPQACEIIAGAIGKKLPAVSVVTKPLADGGEGTAEAMLSCRDGCWVHKRVMGPLAQMKVDAGFAWFEDDRTALVEMAQASGIELLNNDQLNPLETTTYGTGELIRAAAKHGAKKIILAVGGSATCDGGTGAAAALGWKFLDDSGKQIQLGGKGLNAIVELIRPKNLDLPAIEVWCDVDNPLFGPEGAARIYGPQKGATKEMIEKLDCGLEHLSKIVNSQIGKNINKFGAGAAGGLSAGAMAFMDAKLVPGIREIIDKSGLAQELQSADWIITGEGSFDSQSLRGKVVSGVLKAAIDATIHVAVIAGQIKLTERQCFDKGISIAIPCLKSGVSLKYAMQNCHDLLEQATIDFVNKAVRMGLL